MLTHAWREIHLFGPEDQRTPLPGNIGLQESLDKNRRESSPFRPLGSILPNFLNPKREQPDVVTSELNHERQGRVVEQLVTPTNAIMESLTSEEEMERRILEAMENVEVVAYACPQLLIKDFRELFPHRSFSNSRLTVLTLCQKSDNDMTSWTEEMGAERERLMSTFISLAQAIVSRLQESGFWADFIDPFSGRPMLSPFTPATFFETDERYRKLGFELEDVGCCRVIRHHTWGTKSFVGSIFTNAPLQSLEVQEIVRGEFVDG